MWQNRKARVLIATVTDVLDAYEAYCADMERSAWGGQVELRALSKLFDTRIYVHSANGELVMGEGEHAVHLSYHRHAYALGEHYNSLHPATEDS